MKDLRVALAQIAPRLGDIEANLELHRATLERARAGGADLVVFPELSLTGYLLADLVPETAIQADDERIRDLARTAGNMDVILGFVEDGPGHRFHNVGAYLSRGAVVHLHRKLFLPTYGLFQEGREFAAGERLRAFDSPHGPAGILICEDLWHQVCAWLLAMEGAEILFALSNGPTRGARPDTGITSLAVWRQLLQVTAQFLTSYVVYVNRVGCEDGLVFGGGSLVVDPFGQVVAEAPALEEALLFVDLGDEVLRRARSAYPLLRDADIELAGRELDRIRRKRFDLPDAEPASDPAPPAQRRR